MRKLTDVGLVACTLPCLDMELARLCTQPAAPPVIQPSAPEVGLRAPLKKKKAAAIPAETPSSAVHTFPTGPDKDVIMRCGGGWKSNHPASCQCLECLIPAGTIVRRLIQPGFSRESEYLNQRWKGVSRGRFPFCALHCNMRIAEAMFYNICQNALAGGDAAVARLNDAMELIGLKSKKFQKVRMFSCDNYERLSFLGHEALHLLKKDKESGKRNVQVLLEHLWPSGDASESTEGVDFVTRSVELWECWGEVVELMSERNPENLRKWVDDKHGDGFARFGKVCREFCFRYQSMFHKTHCKSFYLHTLLAHGGDFMRELERHGMCLGMMSNSGAERRHEYGRRAFRRSLCGGCWAKHDPELANKANMSAFLTLREILIWQYGSDLLSHEKARLAAEPLDGSESGADGLPSRPAPSEHPRPRCLLTEANLEKHCGNSELAERLNQLMEPLLSPTEEKAEAGRDAPMEADPAGSCLGETARAGWECVRHDQSLALNTIPVPQEEADGLTGDYYSGPAGQKTYDVGRDSRLTNNICDVVSDVDGDGSDDDSSFDGEGSDCSESGSVSSESGSDSSDSRPGPTVRFGEAEFLPDDEECDAERAGVAGGVFGGSTRTASRRQVRPNASGCQSVLPDVDFAFRFADQQSASAGSGSPCANSETSMQQATAASSESASSTTAEIVSGPGDGASRGGSEPRGRRKGHGGVQGRNSKLPTTAAPKPPRAPRRQLTDTEKAEKKKEKQKDNLTKLYR